MEMCGILKVTILDGPHWVSSEGGPWPAKNAASPEHRWFLPQGAGGVWGDLAGLVGILRDQEYQRMVRRMDRRFAGWMTP